jgi:hypothetical protein
MMKKWGEGQREEGRERMEKNLITTETQPSLSAIMAVEDSKPQRAQRAQREETARILFRAHLDFSAVSVLL